jgi:hypothetical protein
MVWTDNSLPPVAAAIKATAAVGNSDAQQALVDALQQASLCCLQS